MQNPDARESGGKLSLDVDALHATDIPGPLASHAATMGLRDTARQKKNKILGTVDSGGKDDEGYGYALSFFPVAIRGGTWN